jgi:hypothetical protein
MSNEIVKQSAQMTQFNYFDSVQFETMQRICAVFANSELVPERYRISEKNPKDKAIANCMIAVETAQRIGASPLMVMQNLDIIQGKPGWSSKFLIATINTCGRYETLQYKLTNLGKVGKINIVEYKWENRQKVAVNTVFDGSEIDNWECIAYTTQKGNGEVLESSEVSVKLAIQEGWYQKAGSKWPTMTKKMLRYRAASFWTNEFAPELSIGFKTADELSDIQDIEYEDVTDKVKANVKANANKETIGFDDPKADVKPEPKQDPKPDSKPVENPAPAAEKKEEKQPETETKEEQAPY